MRRSRARLLTAGAAAALFLVLAPESGAGLPPREQLPPQRLESISESPQSREGVRVMALGDSITGSPGCWRVLLAERLRQESRTEVQFVGSQPPADCGYGMPVPHEGHSGIRVTDVAAQGLLVDWLARAQPDVVLMHYGTNDISAGRSTEEILTAYSELVRQMRHHRRDIGILVAQIIPMNPESCPECAADVAALNIAIPGWARRQTTRESPILVVDQWTGFDTATDTRDGVHPNESGDTKIAQAWWPGLSAMLAPRGSADKRPTTGADGV